MFLIGFLSKTKPKADAEPSVPPAAVDLNDVIGSAT
jgi:hypothetical protein